ncbi:hypothetical protein [Corynebacterium sp.]|uniref:hypothetical protein n=1 Tax=Corynebacterium sp. TaxID=1720 RepID=UPI0026DB6E60|nr:hypothetical protein [Corynebacterium sp.]MDO5032788.1 hypothetical protein [Corynebacterium sp.]
MDINWESTDTARDFFDAARLSDPQEREEALGAMLDHGWTPPEDLFPELFKRPDIDGALVQRLVDAGADPSAMNRFGETAWNLLFKTQRSDEQLWPIYQALLTVPPRLAVSTPTLYNAILNHRRLRLLALLEPYLPPQATSVPVNPATL